MGPPCSRVRRGWWYSQGWRSRSPCSVSVCSAMVCAMRWMFACAIGEFGRVPRTSASERNSPPERKLSSPREILLPKGNSPPEAKLSSRREILLPKRNSSTEGKVSFSRRESLLPKGDSSSEERTLLPNGNSPPDGKHL